MISRLRGVIVEVDGDLAVIDVNGVGYSITCTSNLSSRLQLGNQETLCVHTDVREDAIRLFGFDSAAERHMFLLLNRVSGLGPRSAIDVLSNVHIRDLLRAIGSGDVNSLMSIRGVGKKKAERIVVELRDLVVSMAGERSTSLGSLASAGGGVSGAQHSAATDAVAALEVLGFNRKDAESAVAKAIEAGQATGHPAGDIVREALRFV